MPTAAIIAVDCELQAGHGAVPHPRRLASHEDVPTEVFAVDSDVQADWDHDYVILKLVLAKVLKRSPYYDRDLLCIVRPSRNCLRFASSASSLEDQRPCGKELCSFSSEALVCVNFRSLAS